MAAPNLRSTVVFLTAAVTVVVVLLLGQLECATAEPTKGPVNLRDCDPDGDYYYPSPSPSNCPDIIAAIPTGATVYISCKYPGSNVNGNPWWLYVGYGDYKNGFVPDDRVDCGGVICPYSTCSNPMYS